MTQFFSTREVAKILDLPEGRVRACVRARLLTPQRGVGNALQFSFQDLLLLKTTRDLLDAKIPLPRIRRMLASLRRQLPDDQHLWALTIYADGRRIVAWDGAARWQPDSGQFLFNFDVQDVAERVPIPLRPDEPDAPSLTAAEWFRLGLELEDYSPDEAQQAYRQALAEDAALADAHVNLGRLYHQAKAYAQAEAHYRAAVEAAPDDPVARFNLGVLMDDLGRRDAAIRAYREAIARDPDFADAHYNLGLLFDAMGKRTETITHLRRARALYGRHGVRGHG